MKTKLKHAWECFWGLIALNALIFACSPGTAPWWGP